SSQRADGPTSTPPGSLDPGADEATPTFVRPERRAFVGPERRAFVRPERRAFVRPERRCARPRPYLHPATGRGPAGRRGGALSRRGTQPPGRGTQPPGRGVVYRGPGEPTRTAPHHHRDRLGPGDPDRRARPQPADGAADRGAGSVGRRA